MLAPGDDEDRWSTESAARVVGHVFDVKPGDRETVNCGEKAIEFRDTHIELTLNESDTAKSRRVIVEVAPRWRHFFAPGVDWSTAALRERLEGRCARFGGWMFFDDEHDDEAENTRPGREDNWRATAWEIHPATDIDSVPCPR